MNQAYTPNITYLNEDERDVHIWASNLIGEDYFCLVGGMYAINIQKLVLTSFWIHVRMSHTWIASNPRTIPLVADHNFDSRQ
jgi:hypothetical protein